MKVRSMLVVLQYPILGQRWTGILGDSFHCPPGLKWNIFHFTPSITKHPYAEVGLTKQGK